MSVNGAGWRCEWIKGGEVLGKETTMMNDSDLIYETILWYQAIH